MSLGVYSRIFSSFSWFILGHVTHSDQSRAQAKIFDGLYSEISFFLLLAKSVATETFFRALTHFHHHHRDRHYLHHRHHHHRDAHCLHLRHRHGHHPHFHLLFHLHFHFPITGQKKNTTSTTAPIM